MDLKLYTGDYVRVYAKDEDHFIDVLIAPEDNTVIVDLYPRFYLIEIREKDHQVRIFSFKTELDKLDYYYGWWEDAEIIYSKNEVISKWIQLIFVIGYKGFLN